MGDSFKLSVRQYDNEQLVFFRLQRAPSKWLQEWRRNSSSWKKSSARQSQLTRASNISSGRPNSVWERKVMQSRCVHKSNYSWRSAYFVRIFKCVIVLLQVLFYFCNYSLTLTLKDNIHRFIFQMSSRCEFCRLWWRKKMCDFKIKSLNMSRNSLISRRCQMTLTYSRCVCVSHVWIFYVPQREHFDILVTL